MNNNLFAYSESLVLTLCKEIEYIKNRSKNINYSLKNCQNKILLTRLRAELNKLNTNKVRILNISQSLINLNCEELSFEFLLELSKRSNMYQQI